MAPATKFTLDANGNAPHGNTVTNPGPMGSTTVTFKETALSPVDGTPPAPATRTRNTLAPPYGCCETVTTPWGSLGRASNTRVGVNGAKPSPATNQPFTSANTYASTEAKKHTSPAGDSGAITAFATVAPATKFTLEASGNAPHGYTVTNPGPIGSTTVTFSDTAPAPLDGTPPIPPTCTPNTFAPL